MLIFYFYRPYVLKDSLCKYYIEFEEYKYGSREKLTFSVQHMALKKLLS